MPLLDDAAEVEDGSEDASPSLATHPPLGHKTISAFGSLALLTNNVTGPGVAALPLVFVSAGWLPSMLLLVVLALTSGAAAQLLCDAVAALPGNAQLQRRIELLSATQLLLPRWAYWAAFAAFLLSFQVANVGSIVESAQTTDGLLLEMFGTTCALQLRGGWAPRATCVSLDRGGDAGLDSPFGSDPALSLGFALVAAVTVPLGYYSLDESVWVQQACLVALGGLVFVWLAAFAATGFPAHVPAAGRGAGGLIGTLLFNYMFVATVPSWLNEKAPGVSAHRAVWSSVALGTALFASVGWAGAAAYGGGPAGFTPSRDLLTVLVRRGGRAARAAAYAFPPVALMSGIPVLSICVRYNLLEQGVCSTKAGANAVAVALPWAAALALYGGGRLGAAMDWTSLMVAVPLNLLLPALLYLRATAPPLGEGDDGAEELTQALLPRRSGAGEGEQREGDGAEGGDEGGGGLRDGGLDAGAAAAGAGGGTARNSEAEPGSGDWYRGAGDAPPGAAADGGQPAAPPALPWLRAPRGTRAPLLAAVLSRAGARLRRLLARARATAAAGGAPLRWRWAATDVGRKRAAARAVFAVGAALWASAWAVKLALGT